MAKAAITAKPVEKAAKRARIAVPTKKGPTRGRKGTPPPANRKAVEKAKPSAVASSSKTKIPTKASTTTESEALSKKAKGKKKSIQQEEVPPPSTFKIVAGSYEKLLYGFGGSTSVDKEGKLQFKIKPIFIFPAHVSCIKAVAASPHGGKWLATGSTDEIIKIWDLRRRKEVGGLMHHEGSITHLSFPSRSHLLSASEDGSLCLFRARDWTVLRALKGHKGRVNALTVHPSGKVALSVGKDRTMRMWDLMRGKGCASTKLGKEGEAVRWSADGTRIAVQSGSTIDIFSVSMDLLHTIEHPSRLHDVQFCKTVKGDKEVLLAAGENKKLSIYTVPKDVSEEPKIFAEMIGHGNRVKAFQTLRITLPEASGRPETTVVSTVSSDGMVRIFDMNNIPDTPSEEVVSISPVAEYDSSGTRFTCVALAESDPETAAPSTQKRKRIDDDSDEEEEAGANDESEGEGGSDEEGEGGGEGFGSGWEDEDEEEAESESEDED